MSAHPWVDEVVEALGELELPQLEARHVVLIAGPCPPPLPCVSSRLLGCHPPVAHREGARRARRREGFRVVRWLREWSVPLVGEVAERSAVGQQPTVAGYVTFAGRETTLPEDLATIADPGLRRAVLAEMRRLDNAPDVDPPPLPAPLRPSEATQILPRRPGQPTLTEQWAESDAWRAAREDEYAQKLREKREARGLREWACAQGWRVSVRRTEVLGWSAAPETEAALALARKHSLLGEKPLRSPTLQGLKAQLEALLGPRAKRKKKPKTEVAP